MVEKAGSLLTGSPSLITGVDKQVFDEWAQLSEAQIFESIKDLISQVNRDSKQKNLDKTVC